jgi:hypothetical protein
VVYRCKAMDTEIDRPSRLVEYVELKHSRILIFAVTVLSELLQFAPLGCSSRHPLQGTDWLLMLQGTRCLAPLC